MTKRRFGTPGFSVNTRGHSVLRRSFGAAPPPRRAFGDVFTPEYVPRRLGYESSAEEYALGSAVSNATLLSDHALYESYDTGNKSRYRDAKLLQDASAAIVCSEAPPRSTVASKRVARKVTYSAPPVRQTEVVSSHPASYAPRSPQVIVVRLRGPSQGFIVVPSNQIGVTASAYRAQSEPPPTRAPRALQRQASVPRQAVIASAVRSLSQSPRAPVAHHSYQSLTRPRYYDQYRYEPRYEPRYMRRSAYYAYHRKPRRAKAAIVASKVELEPRRKRPRSKFAAEKLRTTRRPGEDALYAHETTAGLHASRPVVRPRASVYRMESRVDPNDIIYRPGTFVRMREQVREAHDKLDRHRQLLDRYLVDPGHSGDVAASVLRKTDELEKRGQSSRRKY